MRRRLSDERGSQIVEFALVAPILCFLVLAVPVLGMIVRAWVVVEAAAREGSRLYAQTWYLPGSEGRVKERVTKEVVDFGGLKATDTDGTSLFSASDIFVTKDNDCARVTVHYSLPTMLPLLGSLLNDGQGREGYVNVVSTACFLPERR